VQLPVIRGAPAYVVIVSCFPVETAAVSEITSPDRVARLGLTEPDVEEVPGEDAVGAEAGGENVRLMLASALDSPAGEHPTKSGAVSLTLAHSSLLN
jgi:hypothetical protein